MSTSPDEIFEKAMQPPVLRLRKPETPQPFRWPVFFISLIASSVAMFLFGLAMDNTLRAFGIGISSWFDSLWESFLGILFGSFVAPIFWRIGLGTFPQYLLGASALVIPISILGVLVLSQFHDVGISVPGIDPAIHSTQYIATSAYIRLFRSMIFVPVYLGAFYWIFHISFGMEPRQRKGD